jgi:TDG/mug DNA glycosylase family protein
VEALKFAFDPAIDPHTQVLILGSLPGEASLARGQYYAHPQNQFWRLVGEVLEQSDFARLPYEERLAILRTTGIGLWDTVRSAQRKGTLDAAIRNPIHAPLEQFAATLPQLRAVGFNGAKSAAIGRRLLAGTDLALIDLPSSSPAYAGMPFAEKAARWRKLREFLR